MNPYDNQTPLGDDYNPSYTPDMAFKPIEPGQYTARLVHLDPDPESRWTLKERETGEKSYYGRYIAEITEGEYAGRKVYGFISTRVNKYGGTQCHDLANAVGRGSELEACAMHEDLLELVNSILDNEPVVTITVDWDASLKRADGTFDHTKKLYGADKWPYDEDGVRSHIKRVEEGTFTAQASIARIRA